MADPAGQCRTLTISNAKGLHARASAKFVKCAGQFDAEITVCRTGGSETVAGTSIMGLMMLAASRGSTIEICATGQDATKALDALATLVDDRFGEDS